MKPLLILLGLLVIAYEIRGQNWTRTNGPVEDDVFDLCIDSNGVLFAATPLGVNRSTDRGTHWTRPFVFPGSSDVNRVTIAQNGTIIATATSGIFISTDGGESFTQRVSVTGNPVLQFATSGSGRIFAAMKVGYMISDDTGRTWKEGSRTGLGNSLYAVAASHDTILGYTLDNVVYSIDNGETWVTRSISMPTVMRMLILPDGTWLAASYDHGLFRNVPYGYSWDRISLGHYIGKTHAVEVMHDGSLVVASVARMQLVTDLTTWVDIGSGLKLDTTRVTRVIQDTKTKGYYAATRGAGVWKSKPTLVTKEILVEKQPLEVFPNPFNQRATIRSGALALGWAHLELRNVLGNVIWRSDRTSETSPLLIAVPPEVVGTYLLIVRTEKQTESKWVTIIK